MWNAPVKGGRKTEFFVAAVLLRVLNLIYRNLIHAPQVGRVPDLDSCMSRRDP